MSNSKFYTDSMHHHCRDFFNEKADGIVKEFLSKYDSIYPHYKDFSANQKLNLEKDFESKINTTYNLDYSIRNDIGLIDERVLFENIENRERKIKQLGSKYLWYFFSPTTIPINIRELILDDFETLEKYYIRTIEAEIKKYFLRGRLSKKWSKILHLYYNGINFKDIETTSYYGKITIEQLDKILISHVEENTIYNYMKNSDYYFDYNDLEGHKHKVQLIKLLLKPELPWYYRPKRPEVPYRTSNLGSFEFIPKAIVHQENYIDDYLEEENAPINLIREIKGLPKIGEGWISETKLYYQIKNIFEDGVVLHQFSPKWLGRQHFDIYFPDYNIALEYQGKQHFEAIDFFGGEKSFKENQKRDKLKLEKCIQNNCDLIYVEPGYNIEDVCNRIRNSKNFNRESNSSRGNTKHRQAEK